MAECDGRGACKSTFFTKFTKWIVIRPAHDLDAFVTGRGSELRLTGSGVNAVGGVRGGRGLVWLRIPFFICTFFSRWFFPSTLFCPFFPCRIFFSRHNPQDQWANEHYNCHSTNE